MAFDVCDKSGKHIGVMLRPYSIYLNIYVTAITELRIEDIGLNLAKVEEAVAGLFKCKNLMGNVNHEKLNNILGLVRKDEYARFLELEYWDLLKLCMVNNGLKFEDYFNIALDKRNTTGYMLLDASKMNLCEGRVILEEDLDYVFNQEIVSEDEIPLYGRVKDYPTTYIEVQGLMGLRRNIGFNDNIGYLEHCHVTKLRIQSGNFIEDLELSLMLNIRKGSRVQMFFNNKNIYKLFCDGMFYSFIGL
jgi:hypothetical protein